MERQGSSGGVVTPTFTIAKNPNSLNKPPSPSPLAAPPAGAQPTVGHQAGGPALLPTPTLPAYPSGLLQPLPVHQEDHHSIDPFLLQALNQPKDRLTILKLDHELEKFINNARRLRLDLPPMSSYQRLIVHRVAQHFRLHHVVVDTDGQGQKRAIVLFKTPESRVPVIRFLDLLEEEQEPPPQQVKVIMRRQTKSPSPQTERANPEEPANTNNDDAVPRVLRREPVPIEEREEAYLKARARIFNEEAAAKKQLNDGSKSLSDDANDIQRPSSAGSGLERGTEAEEREWEERESARKREKIERELERWRLQQQQQQPQRTPHTGVVSPHPSSAASSLHQLWTHGDAAGAGEELDGPRLLDDSEDSADFNGGSTGSHYASGGDGRRRLGGSGGGGKRPASRNRSPSPVKSGGGGYVPEGLAQPYPGVFVPSGRGRGLSGLDHSMAQPPFVPGFLRGPPVLSGAPYALADSNAFPPLSSYSGSTQGGPSGPFYPAYLPPMPHHHHSLQQQQHFNYQQQQQQHHHGQGFKNDQQPILADYPSMPYSLPPHMPLMPGAPGPYHSQPTASHLPLAVPPLAPLSYPFYPRGEYDRPPPKSTELFDPKAPTASSSSSSTPSASSAPYNPGPSLLEAGAPYYPGPAFNAAPSVRSYSASRSAAGGSASSAYPYAQQQQQQQHQQRYPQQAAPTSAYGNSDDGVSGPMGNMRIATPTAQPQQQQQPWGDHSPLIYAPQAYHHSHARGGGYGVVGNGGRGGGRGGAATNGPFGAGSGATPAAAQAASGTPDGNANSTDGSKAGSLSGSGSGLRTEGGESTTKSDGNSAAGEGEPISGGQAAPRVVSFSHILEVAELSEEVQSNSAEVANIADRLKKAGATNVKSLSSSSIIAIFKNASAAKKALETVESSQFKLRPWVAPLAPGGPLGPVAAAGGAGSPAPSPASVHPPSTSLSSSSSPPSSSSFSSS